MKYGRLLRFLSSVQADAGLRTDHFPLGPSDVHTCAARTSMLATTRRGTSQTTDLRLRATLNHQ